MCVLHFRHTILDLLPMKYGMTKRYQKAKQGQVQRDNKCVPPPSKLSCILMVFLMVLFKISAEWKAFI